MHPDKPQHRSDETTPEIASQDQNIAAKRKSRRALLKAASAAPIIYTLPSGVASANASTCEVKDDNFRKFSELNPDDKQAINKDEVSAGDSLSDGFLYQPDTLYGPENAVAVKGSCWCSLNPTDSGCTPTI
ncbi:MAG: hypothetical protein GVY22_17785 [Gammaproteobacteria bacterium]|jgi:hypothetical protein|nr:hypothetical protein [Gammaproteobacteria bacterium]